MPNHKQILTVVIVAFRSAILVAFCHAASFASIAPVFSSLYTMMANSNQRCLQHTHTHGVGKSLDCAETAFFHRNFHLPKKKGGTFYWVPPLALTFYDERQLLFLSNQLSERLMPTSRPLERESSTSFFRHASKSSTLNKFFFLWYLVPILFDSCHNSFCPS